MRQCAKATGSKDDVSRKGRETLRNLDWCHVAHGDLRIRDAEKKEKKRREREGKRERETEI